MAEDSSGWAKASARARYDAFDPVALARRASDKARCRKIRARSPPGRYTVILEPAAVLDLVGQMFGDFSATAMHDQRSFLTERMGTQALRRKHSRSHDDVAHPLQAGAPFDGEGVPRRKLALVEARRAARDGLFAGSAARRRRTNRPRFSAAQRVSANRPLNIVIAGGDTPWSR